MVQATTPTFVLTLPNDVDPSDFANIYFTLRQKNVLIEKTGTDLTIDGQTVSVYLSQAETLQLVSGAAQIQLNWTYANGSRACSNIVSVQVTENLLKEVVE
ncbi:MAG: hypothetical protein II276_02615 [Bacteroidales bacterium]|nr:hypothetical protein [Bacteroidales bacterium]